ncbi:MAG: LCP family protein [Bacillus sp. (in: firmicutes)]
MRNNFGKTKQTNHIEWQRTDMMSWCKRIVLICFVAVLAACGLNDENMEDEAGKDDAEVENVTFLLIGIDKRGEDRARSDAILVAQYSSKYHSMKVASIMRDAYVKIPGYAKKYNKLNTSYYLGGAGLLKETIYENFGISVDHTVTIDFNGFSQIVDAIMTEGVEVEISQAMIDDMNLGLEPGLQKLHGDQLLKYVRFRHDDQNDFGRVKRQQEVIMKLKDGMADELLSFTSLLKVPQLIEDVMGFVETDIPKSRLISLASSALLHPIEKVDTITIPYKGSFVDKKYEHSGAVLEFDQPKNQEVLSDFWKQP